MRVARHILGYLLVPLLAVGLFVGSRAVAEGGASADWWQRVGREIRAAEYGVTWQERTSLPDGLAAWHVTNRSQGFRVYFTEDAVHLQPRLDTTPPWQATLELVGYGRPGLVRKLGAAVLRADGNRIELDRGQLREWYVNEPRGLKHGFTLTAPPERTRDGSKDGPVLLELALLGGVSLVSAADGSAIDLVLPGGRRVLRYSELRAWDATGRELVARMQGRRSSSGPAIRILLNDEGAVYPLIVDPLITSPAWSIDSGQNGARLGESTATAGDVNGDGFGDVIVGAPGYDNGQADEGRVFVFLGSPAGPSLTADWTAESDQVSAGFGHAVSTAGDLDGDGDAELIVGAPGYTNGQSGEGAAFVYFGSPSGLGDPGTPQNADWIAEGEQPDAALGDAVSAAGDVNGDGYGDVVVGAPGYDNGLSDEGGAFLFFGSASGPGAAGSPSNADWTAEGEQSGARLGDSVSTAGDVDGDGDADLIVGAPGYTNGQPGEGGAFLFLGSPSGPPSVADWAAESDQSGSGFGSVVATAGDVDGDGYADLIVGAPDWTDGQTAEGAAFLWTGGASGPGPAGTPSNAAWSFESDQAGAAAGRAAATAGDTNGDGYADVVVGAPGYTNGESGEGAAFLFPGRGTGLSTTPAQTLEGEQSGAAFGSAASTGGDVDGDGYAEIIVGAPNQQTTQPGEGRALVFRGSSSGTAEQAGWTAESDQAFSNFGHTARTAGDVNGDGYADVVVGADYYDNGEVDEGRAFLYLGSATGLSATPVWTAESDQAFSNFGHAVGAAGDVNGDGYDDLLVSAYFYDNGEDDEGRLYVYHGSASGPSPTPSWTAEIDHVGASLGGRVGTAGDVNGDGYADIIAGATGYTNEHQRAGSAFVYHGSPSGLSATHDWMVEGDQRFSGFGVDVAAAGDVNGDGYGDAIVGAHSYDVVEGDEGRAFLYFGSPSGLSPTADWTVESDRGLALMGHSVSSAGDVNGDGYSDVAVGALHYTNGQYQEGAGFVFLGSPTGPEDTASWMYESNQVSADFGFPVASAGDVNGDGYADVIFGCHLCDNGEVDEGAAFLFLGSAAGLSSSPDWMGEADQASSEYGFFVDTAGDVNGDGYADVIVGAQTFTNGETDEGRAFVYYGNGGAGLALRPRQLRVDEERPVGRRGLSDRTDRVRLSLLGRTPFGRGRVKLRWEVKPHGTLFDGSGLQESLDWSDSAVSGVALDEQATGLPASTLHHWRARLLFDPVTTPYMTAGRWLTVPWKGWNEADLRTADGPAAGAVPNGGSLPGTPLTLGKAAGGDVELSWGASCLVGDDDYSVYEGTLGAFPSHGERLCTTGGATQAVLTPDPGNTYYLVVPHNGMREGSYGIEGSGAERPAGAPACRPRTVDTCD